MKTGKYILAIIVVVSFAFSAGCSKEKHELKDNIWEVESMKVHADSALRYYKQEENCERNFVTLSFPHMGEYLLKEKSYYECPGKVKFGNNNSIKFKGGTCLYINSGSPFKEYCERLLMKNINRYKISDDKLTLTGDNGAVVNLIKQQ